MSETQIWVLLVGLVVTTFTIKALGPVLLGGRELPAWTARVIATVAAPLLAALVAIAVFTDADRLSIGAQTVGVGVGAVVLLLRGPLVVAAVVAAIVTATVRALGWLP